MSVVYATAATRELADSVDRVVRRFDESRTDDETFASWSVRVPEQELR